MIDLTSYLDALSSPLVLVLLGVFGFALLVQLFYYLFFYTGIIARRRKEKKNRIEIQVEQQPVSIIICARNEEDNLRNFLPLVLQQEYPEYEVIVVNDGSTDDTMIILEEFQKTFPHLRFTSIERRPTSIKYPLSPKKMAITMGVKAASYEQLLFIDADCRPASPHWLQLMVRNFTPSTEFILGYGGYFKEKGFLSRLVSYDTLMIAIQSLGMAYRGIPYMGVGRNMAYRKSTFFRLKGFAGHLHVISGDDDLIVNKAGTSENTRIEVNEHAKTNSNPSTCFKEWFAQKRRHLTASSLYTGKSKFWLGLEPFTRLLYYVAIILAVFTFNPVVWVVAGVGILLRFLTQVIIINRCASILGERKFFFLIPLFDILLPLFSCYLMTLDKSFHPSKKNNW